MNVIYIPSIARYSMTLINESELASSCLISYLRILFSSPSFLFLLISCSSKSKSLSFSIPLSLLRQISLHCCLHCCSNVPSYCLHDSISLQTLSSCFFKIILSTTKRIDKTRIISITTTSNSGVIISHTSSSLFIMCLLDLQEKRSKVWTMKPSQNKEEHETASQGLECAPQSSQRKQKATKLSHL